MEKVLSFYHFIVRYSYKHKHKNEKDKKQMDGSEASMIPVIVGNAHIILGIKPSKSVKSLEEFSVGRGIADIFIVKKDNRKLRQRKKMKVNALVELNSLVSDNLKKKLLEKSFIKDSVAIEAKVRDWRRGIKQAMRYKSFAERSYLAVHENHISPPIANIDVFKALNIGLIGVSDRGVTIYHKPRRNEVDQAKYLLATERAYSVVDNAQNSFMVRNNLISNNSSA